MKLLRKLTAFMLVNIMLLSLFSVPVLANYQSAVSNFTIICTDINQQNTNGTYQLQFNVVEPIVSKSIANDGSIPPYPSTEHPLAYYDLYFRNATRGTAYPTQPFVNDLRPPKTPNTHAPGEVTSVTNSLTLDFGSLYLFKAQPIHNHKYPNNSPLQPEIDRPAPLDPSTKTKEVIFLTDIQVTAEGAGSNLTVTWDAPTIDNREIFAGYNIYYRKTIAGGSGNWSNPVYASNDDSVRVPTNKRQYSFTAPNIEVGIFYDIKVEPVVGTGQLFRDLNTLTIGTGAAAVDYNLAYPSKDIRLYRTDTYIKPALRLEESGDKLMLTWDMISTHLNPTKLEVLMKEPGTDLWINIGTLDGFNPVTSINYWHVPRPKNVTQFMIRIFYKVSGVEKYMDSEVVTYDPALYDFYPYRPNILEVTDNVKATPPAPLRMDITWKAFTRLPYTPFEESLAINNYYIDKDIFYDIWVTDNITNFEGGNPLGELEIISSLDAKDLTEEIVDPDKWSYNSYVTQYVTLKDGGGYEKRPLEDNKVYYIKIVARRKIADNKFAFSLPAFRAHYIQPAEEIFLEPSVIAKPPLRIKEDPPGVEVITDNSITIQWDTRWFEVYDNIGGKWYTEVGIDNGNLVFGTATEDLPNNQVIKLYDPAFITGDLNNPVVYNQAISAIRNAFAAIGYTNTDTLAFRLIDLKNAEYEIHVEQYDTYLSQFVAPPDPNDVQTYLNYLNTLDDTQWTKIAPVGNAPTLDFEVKQQHKPEPATELVSNTPYIIFLRPYVTKNDNKKYAYYPSFVVGTTLDVLPPLDITPTVPILEAVSSTETTITVRWKKSAELEYELGYDELLQNYPEGGIKINYEDKEEREENGIVYYYYTIEDLFPKTIHFIWIRSFVDVDGVTKTSAWSNPVSMSTKDISPPVPPRGLGLAAMDNLNAYNKANSTNYTPVDMNYMIIEWMKDLQDLPSDEETPPGATPPAAGSATEVLENEFFKNFILVKFNELLPNKPYYVRAKTILTVSRKKDGPGIMKQYSYTVQLALNEDFIDCIEVTVPPLEAFDSVNMLRAESDWTATLIFNTGKWSGEYDGDVNINTYPLPWEDYEILYDPMTDTMTYRFRTNKTDANGNRDNFVDQRFISRLISDKVFEYNLDLTYYNNRKVTNRVLILPFSIVKAFDERKISLRLRADALIVTFKPDSLKNSAADFGLNGNVTYRFTEVDTSIPMLSLEELYLAAPQKLSISVNTPTRNINMTSLTQPMKVEEKLDNRFNTYQRNVGTYIADANSVGWQRMQSVYNQLDGIMTYSTQQLGAYAALSRNLPQAVPDAPAADAMMNVTSKLNITDMSYYLPNGFVHASQFNKAVFAVANGKLNVAINEPMSDVEFSSMGKSGMLVSGINIPREAAINTLVRLYELKTGSAVKPATAQSRFSDFGTVTQNYRNAILKAETLGFLDGETLLRPKDNLTFAQFFKALDIIILDAGL